MNQLIMILLISMLVLVHEAGHFFAARMCGIRVTRFGIGMPFGPSWKLFRWHNTDFYLHAFLFGGYVSFPEDESGTSELSLKDDPSEQIPQNELYENKTIAQKLFVVSAGVIMNVIFAIFLVMFAALYYHKLPTSNQNIFVDSFSTKITSNIQSKGILKGDKFLKINNQNVDSFYQLTFFAKNSKLFDDFAQNDLVEKNLSKLKKLNPQIDSLIEPNQTLKLPKSTPETPLKVNRDVLEGLEKYKKDGIELSKKEIELRDKIYNQKSYKFTEQTSLKEVARALSDTYKPMSITFLRNDKEITIDDVMLDKDGILGVMLQIEDVYVETKSLKQIVVKSVDYLYTTTKTMLYSLWQLFTGKVSGSDMHGVIAIVKVGGDIIANKGMLNGILLTAMISLNLAIMNFLPIPALDGGHIMFLIVEKLTGKKPSKELGEKINNFFFLLLIALMVVICYNDILALVTKKF